MDPRSPTADEQAGMQWWNSMTEAERAQALEAAGWKVEYVALDVGAARSRVQFEEPTIICI
jgi:hypothetical protein